MSAPTREAPGVARRTLSAGVVGGDVDVDVELLLPLLMLLVPLLGLT